ncbi:uncharacterized protein EI90DRAFT_3037542 [Cantharellus anzutake]|uniref:uncharacterized protein n=1 Tax=Cantharellus anzutake TaxID=1750568 RepID=UPI0019075FD1|nr:uncharacterized protein EI90DRAFT_3037542 [Cantharellus anzutake]KAF8339709.1 hypothetical protein EI90DRAFT_3037542 [Cantharellus anzutake]
MHTILERHASRPELAQALGFSVDVGNDERLVSSSTSPPEPQRRKSGSKVNTNPSHPWISDHVPRLSEYLDAYFSGRSTVEGLDASEDENEGPIGGNQQLRRFHGRSSGYSLASDAQRIASSYRTFPLIPLDGAHAREWPEDAFRDERHFRSLIALIPPPDLLRELLNVYFSHPPGTLHPFIHRPTLEAQIRGRLHERDYSTAKLVLMICAMSAFHLQDIRVCAMFRGVLTPGYQWFSAVEESWSLLHCRPVLAELQACVLAVMYCSHVIGNPALGWVYLGGAVRVAEDAGAHRRSSCPDEIWKRTFWAMLIQDRHLSSWLGRPPLILEEDVDLDLPIALPDEDGLQAGTVEVYRFLLPLSVMGGTALRTMYSVTGHHPAREAVLIAELDESARRWRSSLPPRLRWDPNIRDIVDFERSAGLHLFYYHLRILIYRPFSQIGSPGASDERSRRTCVALARECIRVITAKRQRGLVMSPQTIFPAVTCAVILLTMSWLPTTDRVLYPSLIEPGVVEDIQECLHVLILANKPWCRPYVGRYLAMLKDLASCAGIPIQGLENSVVSPHHATPVPLEAPWQPGVGTGPLRHSAASFLSNHPNVSSQPPQATPSGCVPRMNRSGTPYAMNDTSQVPRVRTPRHPPYPGHQSPP